MNQTHDPEITPETGNGPGQPPRARWLFPAILAVAVLTAVGSLAVTAYPGTAADRAVAAASPPAKAPSNTATRTAPGSSTSATAKPAPVKAPPAAPGVPLDNTHAKASLHTFLGAVATVDSVSDVKDVLSNVATGAIMKELGNEQLELDSNGWTQTGESVVDSVKVIRTTDHGATVQACIDSSAVKLLDSAGKPIGTPSADRRALNIYTLVQNADGTWQVADRSFPDNPTC